MSAKSAWVDGKDVPLRPWEVDLAAASDAALVRLMRALIACHGQITSTFTFNSGSWPVTQREKRSSLGLMVWVPEGHLALFREIAKPYAVGPTKRIQVGMHDWRCSECDQRCPPGHHGGAEWRGVLAERVP